MTDGMILTTTPAIDGRRIVRYAGVVTGEAIMGANIFKDLFAGIRDIVGGARLRGGAAPRTDARTHRTASGSERAGRQRRVGIDLDYETVGSPREHVDGERQWNGCRC